MRQRGIGKEPEYRRQHKELRECRRSINRQEEVIRTVSSVRASIEGLSAEHQATRQQADTHEIGKRTRDWAVFWALVATAVAALLTLMVTHCDNREIIGESRRAANQQHDDTIKSLNVITNYEVAQISIETISQTLEIVHRISPEDKSPGTIINVTWKNFGRNGTTKLYLRTGCWNLRLPIAAENGWSYPLVGKPDQDAALGPNDRLEMQTCVLRTADLQAFINDKIPIVIYGRAIYWDNVRPTIRRETRFCYDLTDMQGNANSTIINVKAFGCGNGKYNCSDDGCSANNELPLPPPAK